MHQNFIESKNVKNIYNIQLSKNLTTYTITLKKFQLKYNTLRNKQKVIIQSLKDRKEIHSFSVVNTSVNLITIK